MMFLAALLPDASAPPILQIEGAIPRVNSDILSRSFCSARIKVFNGGADCPYGLRRNAGLADCAHAVTRKEEKSMNRQRSLFLFALTILLLAHTSAAPAQVPDGTLKITRRTVSPGVGLEWGQGVLTYNGRDYPFSYRAGGPSRDVDTEITTVELSGQVFNLKNPEDFNGKYHKVETEGPLSGGSRVTMKNQNGVVVNVVSPIEGRKFDLTSWGLDVELKK
jgi:hypothetical protein